MTAKQEKLIENYVRTKVRSMLKEEDTKFPVFKITTYTGNQGWGMGINFLDEQSAKKCVAFLTKMGDSIEGFENKRFEITKDHYYKR